MPNSNFRSLTPEEVIATLRKKEPTLILFHVNPDADAIGSAFALSLWLEKSGSPAFCVCADPVPQHLCFLCEGLQNSVTPDAIPAEFENARVITVDTAAPEQLGALFPQFGSRISLMIDHHGKGTPYADYLICPQAAASGEMIFDLMAESDSDVPERTAELLYAAISADTGGFRFSNTTKETHLRAAALLDTGIDAATINTKLFDSKSLEVLRAEKAGFDRISFFADGRVAIMTFPYELKEQLGLENEHLSTLIDEVRCIRGVEVAAVIRQPEEADVFRVSMRSSVDFDVSAVCAAFGGGGHRRAAGATIRAADICQAEDLLKKKILRCFATDEK